MKREREDGGYRSVLFSISSASKGGLGTLLFFFPFPLSLPQYLNFGAVVSHG